MVSERDMEKALAICRGIELVDIGIHCFDPKDVLIQEIAEALAAERKATIEECAKVAENYLVTNKQYAGVSEAIRNLEKGDK